ncbi:MAG: AraC family transcriptional regulator [Rikenellaceae bacterium]
MKRRIGFEGERFVHIASEELRRIKYSSLMNSLYIHSIGYYHTAEHHYVERSSGAQEYILIYCIDGGGTILIGDETHHLEENQLIIIPPHIPHTYYADKTSPWSIYWVHFLGSNAEFFAESFRYPTGIEHSDSSRIENRLNLFEEIFYTLNSGDDSSHIHYANCCFVHFLATIKYLNIYRRIGSDREKSYGDKMVHRLIHYMNENIDKPLSNSDFATFVGYSESYLYRCFHKETGVAPSIYFQNLKIKKACSLLIDTNLMVKHIAVKLGYNDPFYFSKVFNKAMGVSPANYRKRDHTQ